MLTSIEKFFKNNLLNNASIDAASEKNSKQTSRLAAAALMLEVAESDFKETPKEKALIKSLIKKSFKLDESEAKELFQLAEEKVQSSTDDFEFTHLINQTYNAQQKIELIENLWRVAFTDKVLDKYEESIVRRIAELIYVSHKDFISSKLRIEEEFGMPEKKN